MEAVTIARFRLVSICYLKNLIYIKDTHLLSEEEVQPISRPLKMFTLISHATYSLTKILRQNWLEDNHVTGRLLKPHTRNTIFINFAARNTLVAEEGSGVQSMFSVFSVFPNIFPQFY